ncbi:MAG: PEP-CTERM sorting domain-containing protein [Pyrinomonadaceae bacterium]
MKIVVIFRQIGSAIFAIMFLTILLSCNLPTTETSKVTNQNRSTPANSVNSKTASSPALMSTPVSSSPAADGKLTVKGAAVIFLAGRDDIKLITPDQDVPENYPLGRCSGGENAMAAPHLIKIDDKKNFTFKVTGEVDYYGGDDRKTGADGYADQASKIESLGGISGYTGPGGALVGVFLNDLNPQDAKPTATLDFSDEGQKTSFKKLTPELGQIFFIGDGSIGAKSSEQQVFVAPAGATRLFLGTADASGFGGAPGCYEDNKGAFQVEVTAN